MNNIGATADDHLQAFLTSPDWLFQGAHGPSRQYHFAAVSRATYTNSSFLDHRMQPPPGGIEGADIATINRLLANAARPANYVFHSAFCCSTLFSNCLQYVSDSLVLKEPQVLGHLSDSLARSHSAPGFNRQRWQAVLQPCLQLLEKAYPGQAGTVIKPSNAVNNLIPDLLQLRAAPMLFMHGSLKEFLLSNLKGIEASQQMVPLFLRRAVTLTDYVERLELPDPGTLSHLQQCALLWHTQLYHFTTIATLSQGLRFLSARDFLADPETAVSRTLQFFELPADAAKLATLASEGPLSRHSKSGDQFNAEARAAANEALESQHQSELQAVFEWMQPLLETLPVNPSPRVIDDA